MKFRLFNKLYARLFGYFWLPCPSCGEMFGGHEIGGGIEGKCICWKCARSNAEQDRIRKAVGNGDLEQYELAMNELERSNRSERMEPLDLD